jgi:hypothetical protein
MHHACRADRPQALLRRGARGKAAWDKENGAVTGAAEAREPGEKRGEINSRLARKGCACDIDNSRQCVNNSSWHYCRR